MLACVSTIGAERRVKREAVHAVARAVDQQRRRAVEHVPGGDLFRTKLQHVGPRIAVFEPLHVAAKDGKDRTHAHIDVNIARVRRVDRRSPRICQFGSRSTTIGSSFSSDARTPTFPRLPRQARGPDWPRRRASAPFRPERSWFPRADDVDQAGTADLRGNHLGCQRDA